MGVVPEALGFRDLDVLVEPVVALGVLEVVVRRLEMVHQEERLRLARGVFSQLSERSVIASEECVRVVAGEASLVVAASRRGPCSRKTGLKYEPWPGQHAVVVEGGRFLASGATCRSWRSRSPPASSVGPGAVAPARSSRCSVRTPFTWLYWPVMSVARLGVQIELVQKTLSSRMPSRPADRCWAWDQRGQSPAVGADRVGGVVVGHDEQDVGSIR